MEFLSATSFNMTLVVKRFLKIGTFFSTERADRVFQQNSPQAASRRSKFAVAKRTLNSFVLMLAPTVSVCTRQNDFSDVSPKVLL